MSDQLSEIYGNNSQWLKAADLAGGKPVCTIENAEVRENTYNGETKKQIVLTFEGKEKVLGLNVTNARRIADLIGTTDFHKWIGYKIKLFVDKTDMDGKTVDCIRIFPDLPEQPNIAVLSNTDDIPF
jgi:hypothetical protein